MLDGLLCDDSHLHATAPNFRERNDTATGNTVALGTRLRRLTHGKLLAATMLLLIGACGGGRRSDTHAKATDLQGECCENLQGAARDQCLRDIVRVDDPAAATTSTNQSTYACVVEHFVCNPATGRPTQASAQAQYDCMDDLQ